ncbi:uncharacterized protein EV154DRAFT_508457 [Mucor mucedo]|uniref:Uncharacterized protein n=1 Tax=Mucor saturninus TaxID=64648 RepID=A0A8H7R389_9FUNG|nr:uncharacterized protein EV154DRAFT_508457 [Mucor mucedo]KAG2202366.1 hypothetical protein INT47_008837 [Mucor saturninus]KAI7891255.1 hypothetical protein EV154DRAFT_508457 [Mucor mucedo]
MEGFNDSYNIALQALGYLTQAYTFCYLHLKELNINLPAPDQVVQVTTSFITYIVSHSPTFIQQLVDTFSQLPIESNYFTIILLLIIAYIAYCFILATFRWVYRLVFGFVRFSFFLALVASLVYVVQQYLAGAALFPGTSTTTSPTSPRSL